MPVLIVYGIPEDAKEIELQRFWEALRDSVVAVKELDITKDQVSVFFPSDRLKEGLGEEIIVFVEGLFDWPERTKEVRKRLAEIVAETAKKFFPKTNMVECFVRPFDPGLGFANA